MYSTKTLWKLHDELYDESLDHSTMMDHAYKLRDLGLISDDQLYAIRHDSRLEARVELRHLRFKAVEHAISYQAQSSRPVLPFAPRVAPLSEDEERLIDDYVSELASNEF